MHAHIHATIHHPFPPFFYLPDTVRTSFPAPRSSPPLPYLLSWRCEWVFACVHMYMSAHIYAFVSMSTNKQKECNLKPVPCPSPLLTHLITGAPWGSSSAHSLALMLCTGIKNFMKEKSLEEKSLCRVMFWGSEMCTIKTTTPGNLVKRRDGDGMILILVFKWYKDGGQRGRE